MTSLDARVALDDEDHGALAEMREGIEAKLSRLRELEPCILDMSFREATLSSRYGHTLADKIELYELAREFGFTDFGLSNFYDFPSVTDQDYLLENDISLDEFLVTIAVEPGDGSNAVARRPAVVRTKEVVIPNVILLVEVRSCTVELSGRDRDEMRATSIATSATSARSCRRRRSGTAGSTSAWRARLRPDVSDQPGAGRQPPRATSLPVGEARRRRPADVADPRSARR